MRQGDGGCGAHGEGGALPGARSRLKIRYADFRTITRQRSIDPPITDAVVLARTASDLLGVLEIDEGIRLLGVGMSNLGPPSARQLDLLGEPDTAAEPAVTLDEERRRWAAAGDIVAEVRKRFGDDAVAPATLWDADGMRRRRRGPTQQWGPDSPGDPPV